MRLSGSYRFDIPRERLWDTLMDPAVVGSCIPGVRAFTPLAPDKYEIELGVSVGAISGAYKCMLEVADKTAPASYRMTVRGSGARTNITGSGTIALSAEEDATELSFQGDVQVTGVLARVGQRLMGNVAKSQIDRFFECLRTKVAAGP